MVGTSTTARLHKLATELPGLIREIEADIALTVEQMSQLKDAGLVYATEHWRKGSNGEPKYFYLLYPQKAGERRRREYVGCSFDRIEEARKGIARAREYDELACQLSKLTSRVDLAAGYLGDACRHLMIQH